MVKSLTPRQIRARAAVYRSVMRIVTSVCNDALPRNKCRRCRAMERLHDLCDASLKIDKEER